MPARPPRPALLLVIVDACFNVSLPTTLPLSPSLFVSLLGLSRGATTFELLTLECKCEGRLAWGVATTKFNECPPKTKRGGNF